MKIGQVEIYKSKIPFNSPYTSHGVQISHREGFFIKLISTDESQFGYGECFPFPGLHRHDLEECFQELATYQKKLSGPALSDNLEKFDLDKPFWNLIDLPVARIPVVQYAIEQSMLTLIWNTNKNLLLKHMPSLKGSKVETNICALVVPQKLTLQDAKQTIRYLRNNNFDTVKVKIGRHSLKKETQFIKYLAGHSNFPIHIRLDANGVLTYEELAYLGQELEELPIQYIEDPFHSYQDLNEIPNICNLPIAIDQTLEHYLKDGSLQKDMLGPHIKALVIKPTTQHGMHKTMGILKSSFEKDIPCVLSSTFDSPWSLMTHAMLCHYPQKNPLAQGLHTHHYMAKSPFGPSWDPQNGVWCIETDFKKLKLNSSMLKKIM